jgi:hypothetical protein
LDLYFKYISWGENKNKSRTHTLTNKSWKIKMISERQIGDKISPHLLSENIFNFHFIKFMFILNIKQGDERHV